MVHGSIPCTPSQAWRLFWQLAEEQQDLALLISAKLPRAVLRELQSSCSTMRRLVNAGVTVARVDAGDIEWGTLLGDVFPALRDLTLRQARMQRGPFMFFDIDREWDAMRGWRFLEVVRQQLIGTQLGRQLEALRVLCYLEADYKVDDEDTYPEFLSICAALPRLRTFRIAGVCHDWLKFCEQPRVTASPAGGGLTDLYVEHTVVSDVVVALPAAQLQQLQRLWMEVWTELGETLWRTLAALPSLVRVDLQGCMTPDAVAQLSALQHLRELGLAGIYASCSRCHAELARLTQLTWLRLWEDGCEVEYQEGLAGALTALTALRHLEIWDGTLACEGLALFALPQLTHLACVVVPPGNDMHDNEEEGEGNDSDIGSAANSQRLTVANCVPVTSSLRSLRLLTTRMVPDEDGIYEPSPAPGLTRLQFTAAGAAALTALILVEVHPEDLYAAVRMFTQLRSLELINPATDNAQFASVVPQLIGLQALTLSSDSGLVGDAGMRAVSVLTQLTRLCVRRASGVGDAGLLPLTCLQRLRSIGWEDCKGITVACIDAFLASHPQLHCRMWGYNDMSPSECKRYYAYSPRNQVELLADGDS